MLAGILLVAAPPAAFANSVPNAPIIGVAIRGAGSGSGSVEFSPNGDGGVGISSFTAKCTSTNGGATGSAGGTASPILVSSLTNGKVYTCRVTATNALGTSAPSNPSNTFVPISFPDAPTAVSGVPGNKRATVTWTAPASNGGSAITGYLVTPYLSGVEKQSSVFNTTATTQTVVGLANTQSYTFTVAAINLVSSGTRSAPSSPILIGLPTAPTNLSAVASPGRATVKWIAPRPTVARPSRDTS